MTPLEIALLAALAVSLFHNSSKVRLFRKSVESNQPFQPVGSDENYVCLPASLVGWMYDVILDTIAVCENVDEYGDLPEDLKDKLFKLGDDANLILSFNLLNMVGYGARRIPT